MQSKSHHVTLPSLADHFINNGLLDESSARKYMQQAEKMHLPLVSYLVQQNILSSEAIFHYCTKNFHLPVINDYHKQLNQNEQIALNPKLIQHLHAYPLILINNELHLAISDPTNATAIETLSFHTGWKIKPVLTPENQLAKLIESYNQDKNRPQTPFNLESITINHEEEFSAQDNTVSYDEPIIKLVDAIILHAIQQFASDIHIEPYNKTYRIRYRQDGILTNITDIQSSLSLRLITRLKVMAKLDITERRLPQDGRIQVIDEKEKTTDIRINTCPTLLGEKIALRILNSNHTNININTLGFTKEQEHLFITKISQPQGLILVTGPTGSGKTLTLYSALHYLNKTEKNISTVEDPVEIQISGINQINVHPKIGLSFSSALRALLRQDPDIIMLGEIRDYETATVAMQAAQTGHLVLSTVHTNNAIDTIIRLQAMGISPHNLISAVTLIIAQRLLRKLCTYCNNIIEKAQLELKHTTKCSYCRHGYCGRTAVFELLPITEEIISLLLSHASPIEIVQKAKLAGFKSMQEVAYEKVQQGITNMQEIHRVIGC
ncbi:MAG: hypothetical protein A3E83_02225 [Gammaproteobacteria bacterium RIFCSPHIGHO2_12_FULL_41_20]|nr:MAG: hypothetical protein A3E83_02225 [Gammaproteobacteria bacterium RIFCSPHIGHO2_12_FULL_41_20]